MKYKNQPAWSMPSAKIHSKQDTTPGPGAYSTEHKLLPSSPAFSIGRSRRSELAISNIMVGPGSYTPTKKISIKAIVFGSSPKSILQPRNSTPGVGQYSVQSPQEGARYTIQGRNNKFQRSSTPGPGHYNHSVNLNHQSYRFGKAHKIERFKSSFPGPGSYEIKASQENRGIVFTTEKRKILFDSEGPGPGAYSIPTIKDNKSFSIKGKYSPKSNDCSPGPGKYYTPLRFSSSSSIGRSKRFAEKPQFFPGPGAYDTVLNEHSTAAIFPKSSRHTEYFNSETPGPGKYDIPEKIIEGPHFSLRQKTGEKKLDVYPGPGAYNIQKSVSGMIIQNNKVQSNSSTKSFSQYKRIL